ncbi:hypothetical protein JTB14_025654 [Gonioctena quinquepunctata]|nr:hypothetical protein JTB14_025654 [Gonioctena quinquepunctata]
MLFYFLIRLELMMFLQKTTDDSTLVASESAGSSIVTGYENASDDFLGFPDSAESEAVASSSTVGIEFDYIPPETVGVENENPRRETGDRRLQIHLLRPEFCLGCFVRKSSHS